MILNRDFPPDVRVEREAKTLLQDGHDVHIVSMNRKNWKVRENILGMEVQRLKWIRFLPTKINRIANIPHFLNPRWLMKTVQVVLRNGIEVIHVHDLPLAPVGIIVGKLFSIPVIFDNHEYYPAFLRSVGYRGLLLFVLFHPFVFDFVDRLCKRMADVLLCTAEESKSIMVEHGIQERKIYVLMNTVNLDSYLTIEIKKEIVEEYRKFYTITYIGGFGKHRNLELVIDALPAISEKIKNIRFLVVGGDERRRKILEQRAVECGVQDKIIFTDWVSQEMIPSFVEASRICIIPHQPSPHTNTTTPNKLFQYMALGKPLITTPIKPVKSIIEKAQCGLMVSNSEEFADAVVRLYKDKRLAKKMGENGREAVNKTYNWNKTSVVLREAYRNIR